MNSQGVHTVFFGSGQFSSFFGQIQKAAALGGRYSLLPGLRESIIVGFLPLEQYVRGSAQVLSSRVRAKSGSTIKELYIKELKKLVDE